MNTRSMIFTIFGDYIRHYGNEIWMGSLISLMREFGHNEQSVRAAISRMYKQGWLKSRKKGNKSFYRLTERGVERMEEAGKRIFKLKPEEWDGKWRMFLYSIPEGKRSIREDVKTELGWSGFAPMSTSCWITPNDLGKQVDYLIEKYEIAPFVHYFTAAYNGPGDNKRIVEQCWNLDEINGRYAQFLSAYEEKFKLAKRRLENGTMANANCFVEKTMLVHEYRKFLFIDPGLPEGLLPDLWLGQEAAALFSSYYKLLAPYAAAFYESVSLKEIGELERTDTNILHHPFITE
ncbi:MAG TPA: phenylacetic acid degradation operon negative regulatory protein PaaX [Bacillaceae bacterium]